MYAFVDLDYCLVKKSSNIMLIKILYNNKQIQLFSVISLLFSFILYKLGLINEDRIFRKVIKKLKYTNGQKIQKDFYNEFISKEQFIVNSKVIKILKILKSKGYKIIIVSGSSFITCNPICDYYNFYDSICSEIELIHDVITGEIIGNVNLGKNKVIKIIDYLKYDKGNLKQSVGFSDSYKDIGFLELTEYKYIVNGDKKLKKHANMKNWTVIE